MTKYLLLIDTDNPADIQVFTPQDALPDAQPLVPAAPAPKPVQAATTTRPRQVTKAKATKSRRKTATPPAPSGEETTVNDAARQLGVSPSAVHYQLKVGGLTSRKDEKGVRRIAQDSVDAFRARNGTDQPPTAGSGPL